jgi:hypothetical protein
MSEDTHTSNSPAEQASLCKNFVIISTARSGTKLLVDMLKSHPDIICEYELFNYGSKLYKKTNLSASEWHHKPQAALEAFWKLYQGQSKTTAVGFKLLRDQNEQAEQLLLNNTEVYKIILYRKNHIRHYYSSLAAHKSAFYGAVSIGVFIKNNIHAAYVSCRLGKYHHASLRLHSIYNVFKTWLFNRKLYVAEPLNVDFDGLEQFIHEKEQFYSRVDNVLRETNQSAFTLYYEDINTHSLQKLLGFLELANSPLSFSEKKLHNEPLKKLITNYDALKQELDATAYYDMLTDP